MTPETNEPAKAGRLHGGRFAPGVSGNPAGRKAGSRHKATVAALALLEGQAARLTRRAVDLALEGDATALRLCLERVLPRGRRVTIELPALADAASTNKGWDALLAGLAVGALTVEEASAFGALLEARRRAIETGDLEIRIAALEEVKGARR